MNTELYLYTECRIQKCIESFKNTTKAMSTSIYERRSNKFTKYAYCKKLPLNISDWQHFPNNVWDESGNISPQQ